MLLATAACKFSTSELQKVLRECGVLCIFTYKCVSRHSGVGTSKSAPRMWCFVHFHANVLLATAARNFSTSELQKVLRERGVCCIFTYKRASCHSGVQFFDVRISKSAPNLTCFVHFDFKVCFSPQQRAIFDFSSDHMTPHPPL